MVSLCCSSVNKIKIFSLAHERCTSFLVGLKKDNRVSWNIYIVSILCGVVHSIGRSNYTTLIGNDILVNLINFCVHQIFIRSPQWIYMFIILTQNNQRKLSNFVQLISNFVINEILQLVHVTHFLSFQRPTYSKIHVCK